MSSSELLVANSPDILDNAALHTVKPTESNGCQTIEKQHAVRLAKQQDIFHTAMRTQSNASKASAGHLALVCYHLRTRVRRS